MGLVQMEMAKAMTAIAFRNGPLEDIHAGKTCPTCSGSEDYSHITQAEMKALMKYAVDHLYAVLMFAHEDSTEYGHYLMRTNAMFTQDWDGPENTAKIVAQFKKANAMASP